VSQHSELLDAVGIWVAGMSWVSKNQFSRSWYHCILEIYHTKLG
jgi:hypothetical protein